MFLDGISIFLIFVPLLMPIANTYQWDAVWFGVILTLMVAVGQFTPPLAVNLMVSCRIAKVPMESTVRWVGWLLASMLLVLILVIDRKRTRLNSSHLCASRMPSSACKKKYIRTA